jgi:hypothetical protein
MSKMMRMIAVGERPSPLYRPEATSPVRARINKTIKIKSSIGAPDPCKGNNQTAAVLTSPVLPRSVLAASNIRREGA